MALQGAAGDDTGTEDAIFAAENLQFDLTVAKEKARVRGDCGENLFLIDRNSRTAAEGDDFAGSEFEASGRKGTDAKFRTLKVGEDGDGVVGGHELPNPADPPVFLLPRAVGAVQSGDGHARIDQALDPGARIDGGAQGTDDFGASSHGFLGFDGEVECDFEFEDLRDGATGFGGFGGLADEGFVGSGDLGSGGEGTLGEFEVQHRDRCGGLDGLGDDASLVELSTKGHAEAARVSGGNQLFGINAHAVFEAGVEAVGGVLEPVALSADRAFAFFQAAIPNCG